MIENPGTGGFNTGKVNNLSYQSEGFPLTGYFVPACVGRWAWPGQKNCRRAVAAVAVGVIWKMPKYEEMHTFSKMGMSQISRNVYFSEIKAPAGASDRQK